MKKFTLYLLITLLAVNAVGCGSEADTSVTAATTESAQSETEPVVTTPVSPVEAKDFDGREYRVITSPNTGEAWALNEVYSEGANGDVLNDIIFERNRYLEEKFNISISVTNKSEYLPEVKTTVLANEDAYDLALAPLVTAFNWSSAGYLTEISEVPYLDVSASWWSQNALTNNSINHKNYFLMGNINLLAYDSVGVLYFNKEMLTANNMETPYQLVRDGKWTYNAMLEMCMNVSADLDGNNIYDEKDSYGLGLNSYGAWTFSYGGGLSFMEKDNDDIPYLKLDDSFVDFFQMFVQGINSNNSIMYGDKYGENRVTYINNAFKEGRLLFLNEMFNRTSLLRDMEMDFGLVPMPKADESQENYRHFIHQDCSSVTCVPITVSDLDFVGCVLEDMAYYSHYNVYPTYIETAVKTKYLRDEESVEMADIILNNIVFDIALTSNSPILGELRTMLTKNDINIASKFDAKKKICEASLKKAIAGYLE